MTESKPTLEKRLQLWDDFLFVINNKRLSLDAMHVVTLWKDIAEAKNEIVRLRGEVAVFTEAVNHYEAERGEPDK